MNATKTLPENFFHPPSPHLADAPLDEVMTKMDRQYRSRFCEWVSEEDNMESIVFHFSRMVSEYRHDTVAIHRATRWLVSAWDVPTIANFLIRVFYHWGIASEDFGQLVSAVIQDWEVEPYTVQLVLSLATGERPPVVASLLNHITKDWDTKDILSLVSSLSFLLDWTSTFFQDFIVAYVTEKAPIVMTPEVVRDHFLQREKVTNNDEDPLTGEDIPASPDSFLEMGNRDFALLIFEICLADIHEDFSHLSLVERELL